MNLAVNLKCIVLRNGIEIWLESDRAENLDRAIIGGHKGFIKVDDNTINTADVVGIFTPAAMEELKRRKQGFQKCKHGKWIKDESECSGHIKNTVKQAPEISESQRQKNITTLARMRREIFG